MTATATRDYRSCLTLAFLAVEQGNRADALLALRAALSTCNGSAKHRSAVFRAMNYVRCLPRVGG